MPYLRLLHKLCNIVKLKAEGYCYELYFKAFVVGVSVLPVCVKNFNRSFNQCFVVRAVFVIVSTFIASC